MKPLREFIEKHRAAAVIIAAAVAVFAVWEVYAVVNAGGPAATTSVDQPAARPTPAAAGAGGPSRAGPAGSAAMRAAGHLTGAPVPALPGAPSSGASTGAPPAGSTAAAPAGVRAPAVASAAPGPPPSTGRSDPFAPLVTPGGGSPASINPTLPPVPPLAPGSFGPSASNGAGSALPGLPGTPGTRGQFQLTGIVVGPSAVAILNDGAGSYIVEPGDTVMPGVRVVAIDAQNQTVTLISKDQSWQLRLKGGTSR